jgi:hypothetical protein
MVTAEPENFVHLFCAVVYDLLRRILWADEGALARDVEKQWTPPRHRPWLSSWRPSYLSEYAYVSPEGQLFGTRKVYPYRSRYRKCRRRTSSHGCPSRALEQWPVQTSHYYDLVMWGIEGTLHFRPTVIPCTHLLDHNRGILRIKEGHQRPRG